MQIAVIIERDGADYRARCRHPVAAEADGHSRYDARANLEALLKPHVSEPIEWIPFDPETDGLWVSYAGSIPDDELTEGWLDAVAAYRRECDPIAPSPPLAQPRP